MKIVILGDASSVHTYNWCRLSSRIAEIHLVSLELPNPKILKYVRFHKINISKPFGYVLGFSQVRRIINEVQPDIMHAHYATGYGFLGATQSSPTKYLTVWGSDIFQFPQKSVLHYLFMKFILRSYSRIFSTSVAMAVEVEKFNTVKAPDVIPFGIDTERFAPDEENASWRGLEQRIHIGTVKTLEYVYGIDTLIKAFANAQTRNPDYHLTLSIYGTGSLLNELESLANDLCKPKTVLFHGSIDSNEVPKVLNRLDIFVALSREESFGVSMLEAMSVGLPVITTKTPGPTEYINNGQNGVLVDIDSFTEASDAISTLINNPILRRSLGLAARATVVKDYSSTKTLQEIGKIYSK